MCVRYTSIVAREHQCFTRNGVVLSKNLRAGWGCDTAARGLALVLPLHSLSHCAIRSGGRADPSEPASCRADSRTVGTALLPPYIAQHASSRPLTSPPGPAQ